MRRFAQDGCGRAGRSPEPPEPPAGDGSDPDAKYPTRSARTVPEWDRHDDTCLHWSSEVFCEESVLMKCKELTLFERDMPDIYRFVWQRFVTVVLLNFGSMS